MIGKLLRPVTKALRQRMSGQRPSVWQSVAAAASVGVAAAGVTYRLLRGGGDK